MIAAGVRWWTTQQAVNQLGIDRKVINQWVRRSRLAGHLGPVATCPACPAAAGAWPHVDPPVRAGGRLAGYQAEQLLAAEAHTAGVAV